MLDFENIGKKIKSLAVFITWVGIIASFIGGMIVAVMIAIGELGMDDVGVLLRIAIALIVCILIFFAGWLFSWVSTFILYGFGQLVHNTDILVKYVKKQDSNGDNLLNALYDDDDVEED